MNNDIFISYRREGGKEIARTIKAELERMGFSVFLDFDELNDGHYEPEIIKAIDSSSVFMLILSPKALDLCWEEDDWVRKEIEYAINKNRHIVPINPDQQFEGYPNTLPSIIQKELPSHQISDLMLGQLFKVSLSKLVTERIIPNLNNTTLLHIKIDSNCIVKKYGREILELDANELGAIKLVKGKYLLDFVDKDNQHIHKEILYETTSKAEDYLNVKLNNKFSIKQVLHNPKFTVGILLSILLIFAIICTLVRPQTSQIWFSEDNTYFVINDVRFDLVYVQGGPYIMGNNNGDIDERPEHKVIIPNFYIGKYEISQEQWEVIMGNNPSFKQGAKYPIENITWFEAYMFIRKLNELTGRKFQLPTEA